MIKLKIYSNGELDEEEKVLVEINADSSYKVLMYGDYYHDKINEKIQGFCIGLDYCGVNYEFEESEVVYENDELFKTFEFNL